MIRAIESAKNFLISAERALSSNARRPQPCGYSTSSHTAPADAVPMLRSPEWRESSEQKNLDESANAARPFTDRDKPFPRKLRDEGAHLLRRETPTRGLAQLRDRQRATLRQRP